MVCDLDDFMILNTKSVDYRCFVCNISKNTVNQITKQFSTRYQRHIMNINFGTNKTPVEIIK